MASFGGLSLETRVSEEGSERWISLGSLLHSTSVAAEEVRSGAEPRPAAPQLPARAPMPTRTAPLSARTPVPTRTAPLPARPPASSSPFEAPSPAAPPAEMVAALRPRPTPGGFGVAGAPGVRRKNQLASSTGGIKNRAVYIILAVAMGPIGIHNFYAGYKGRGITQLLISIFLSWMIFPFALVCFWVLVEIFTVEKDASGVPFG